MLLTSVGVIIGNYFFLIPKMDFYSRSKQGNILCSYNNEVYTALQNSVQSKLTQAILLFYEDKIFSLYVVQINTPGEYEVLEMTLIHQSQRL